MAQQTATPKDDFTLPVVNLTKAGLYGWVTYWLVTVSGGYFELLPVAGVWTGYHTLKQTLSAIINHQSLADHDRKIGKFRKRMKELSTSALAVFADLMASKNLSFDSGVFLGQFEGPKKKLVRLFAGLRYHVAVIAPPGMNKTMAIVVPSILQWTRKMGHLLVNDPSGEILSICSPHLKKLGFTIVVICPFMAEINRLIAAKEPWSDAGLDLFSALDDPTVKTSQIRQLLMEAATWLVPDQPTSSKEDFFPQEARDLAEWLAMNDLKQGRHPSLVTMQATLMEGHQLVDLLHEEAGDTHFLGGWYGRQAATLYQTATEAPAQFMGGVGTLKQLLGKFDAQSDFGQHVGEPTYRLSDLADRKRRFAFFVCYPPEKADKFAKQLSMTLNYLLDRIAAVNSKTPTTAFLDECGALRFPLASKLNQYRKLGLRCVTIWQDLMGQSLANHGRAQTNQLMAASHAKAYIGITEPETLKQAETACGSKLVAHSALNNHQGDKSKLVSMGGGESMQKVPVLASDEIRQLPDDRLLIVVGNDKPIVAIKTAYWELPDLAEKAGPSPYHVEDAGDE